MTDNVSFEVKAESADEFSFPIKTWSSGRREEVAVRYTSFTINGQQVGIGPEKNSIENGDFCQEQQIPLSGRICYK